MLIDVDAPFKGVYRKAYLRVGSEGRSLVDLVNSSKDRTTISYARKFNVNKSTVAKALYNKDY